jgi:threonylcarbamoyladenosine tRNA methylthiotransferase MtaB
MFIYFSTLGCKLNYSETSTLKRIAEEKGFKVTRNIDEADFIVVNTCTVTHTADKKSRYTIRHLHQLNPKAKILVTGCYAESDSESIKKIEGVSIIFGNNEKELFESILQQTDTTTHNLKNNTFFKSFSLGDRTRSFLKIQDGCNYFCSYCKIPFVRGRSRNASIDEILNQVNIIEKNNVKEVVLTGINIGDFGHTTKENFLDLLISLEKKTSIPRYRISSIEPNLLTNEIIDFILQSSRFMPHFHIPLQSGSNYILKLMNRKYSSELFVERVQYIKQKDPFCCIGTDVIVGFPGEKESHFQETFSLINNLELNYLHVFEYSDRKGTKAYNLPNKINDKLKKERSEILRKLSKEKQKIFVQKNINTTRKLLIESKITNKIMTGFTENYIKVGLSFEKDKINSIVNVKIIDWSENYQLAIGEIV